MKISWSEIAAIIAILASLVGFTFSGPGNIQQIAQGVFYLFTVIFFITLFKRLWPRSSKHG